MAEPTGLPMRRWRYGMHPNATDMRIVSLGRVHLQLGEALRLEMAGPGPGSEDTVHLQYYIATELGPWALWLSCPRNEVADSEAFLRDLTPPLEQD
jgi:hypothetical protein